jgi:dTMP kinase
MMAQESLRKLSYSQNGYRPSRELNHSSPTNQTDRHLYGNTKKIIKNGSLERDGITNLLLFTASRHALWQRAEQELESGRWVLSARNYISTLVYQGYGEGVNLDLISETTRAFTSDEYIHPDLTVILGLTHEERERRIAHRGDLEYKDTFESRGREFQDSLNHGYEKIASQYHFPLIDASKSIDEIQHEIRKLLPKH